MKKISTHLYSGIVFLFLCILQSILFAPSVSAGTNDCYFNSPASGSNQTVAPGSTVNFNVYYGWDYNPGDPNKRGDLYVVDASGNAVGCFGPNGASNCGDLPRMSSHTVNIPWTVPSNPGTYTVMCRSIIPSLQECRGSDSHLQGTSSCANPNSGYATFTVAGASNNAPPPVATLPTLSQPQSVSLSNCTNNGATATLAWGGVPNAQFYQVRIYQGTPGNVVNTIDSNRQVSSPNIDISGLTPGTSYYINVQSHGDGYLSSTVSSNTPFVCQAAPVPTKPAVSLNCPSNTTATVSWDNGWATSNQLSKVEVRLDRYQNSPFEEGGNWYTASPGEVADTNASPTSPYTINGLVPGAKYAVKIRGVNASGVGIESDPAIFPNNKTSCGNEGVAVIRVSEVAGGVNQPGYETYTPGDPNQQNQFSIDSTGKINLKYTFKDKTAGTKNLYFLMIGTAGTASSPISRSIALSPPVPPTITSATCQDGRVNISWTGVDGASSYELRAARNADATPSDWATRNHTEQRDLIGSNISCSGQCSFSQDGIIPGSKYFIWIHSKSEIGLSTPSTHAVTCPELPATAESSIIVACNSTRTKATVTWGDAGTGVGQYQIRYNRSPVSQWAPENTQSGDKTPVVQSGARTVEVDTTPGEANNISIQSLPAGISSALYGPTRSVVGKDFTCEVKRVDKISEATVQASCDAKGKVTLQWDSPRGVTFAVRGLVGNVDNNTTASTSPNITNGDERNGAINQGITASSVTDTSAHYTYVSAEGQAKPGEKVRMWVVGYRAGLFGASNSDPAYAPVVTCAAPTFLKAKTPTITNATCSDGTVTVSWESERGRQHQVRGKKTSDNSFTPTATWTNGLAVTDILSNGDPNANPEGTANGLGFNCVHKDDTFDSCTYKTRSTQGGAIPASSQWKVWVTDSIAGATNSNSEPGLTSLITCSPTSLPKPGAISAVCTSDGKLKISWSAPAGGTPPNTVYDLRIDRDPVNGNALPTEDASWSGRGNKIQLEDEVVDNLPTTQTDYTKTGVTGGQKYQVWVQTRDSGRGTASDISYSTEVSCAGVVAVTKVRVAESQGGLDNAAQYREFQWQSPMKVSYEFRDKTQGTKTIFVRFYGSDGSVQPRSATITLGTVSPPPGACIPGDSNDNAVDPDKCVSHSDYSIWKDEYLKSRNATSTDWTKNCNPNGASGNPGIDIYDQAIWREAMGGANRCPTP